MNEKEKLEYTKAFIDKLANGINPIDNSIIPENDLFNNVRISRCMHYISSLLDKAIKNCDTENISTNKKSNSNKPIFFAVDDLKTFVFSAVPVPVNYLTKQLNNILKSKDMIRLHQRNIKDYMLKLGYLELQENQYGVSTARPSQRGIELGLGLTTIENSRGDSIAITYNTNAQRFILENINKIAELRNTGNYNIYSETVSNRGKAWTAEQEQIMIDSFNKGISLKEIAEKLQRTTYAVQLRLEKLGLIKSDNLTKL